MEMGLSDKVNTSDFQAFHEYKLILSSVPAGVVTAILILIAVPNNFPYQGIEHTQSSRPKKFSKENLLRLDLLGSLLLLGASLIFVTVLLEAGTEFSWGSATAIVLLVVSAVLLALFLWNERTVTNDNWRPEPIFPWRYLFNRAWMGTLLYVETCRSLDSELI